MPYGNQGWGQQGGKTIGPQQWNDGRDGLPLNTRREGPCRDSGYGDTGRGDGFDSVPGGGSRGQGRDFRAPSSFSTRSEYRDLDSMSRASSNYAPSPAPYQTQSRSQAQSRNDWHTQRGPSPPGLSAASPSPVRAMTSRTPARQARTVESSGRATTSSSMRGTAVSGPGFGSASGPGVVGTGTGTVTGSREPPLTRPSSPITQAGTNLSDPVNVAEQLESLQLTSFLVRPGFGKAGRPVKVNSNYFAVRSKTGRGKIIYHYDVDIVPVVKVSTQKQPRGLLRAVWEQFVLDHVASPWAACIETSAFDGRRNIFSPDKFPIPAGEKFTLKTSLNPTREVARPQRDDESSDEYRRFTLTFKLVAMIDLEYVMELCRPHKHIPRSEEAALTGIMCVNVLLRDFPAKKYAQVGSTGNKFFTLEGARPIPQGAVVCRGFLQSFRYSNSGLPLINIDLDFSAFVSSGPALEVVNRILGSGPGGMRGGPVGHPGGFDELNEGQIAILKRKLRGAKFTVTHRQSTRLHTVITITLKPAVDIVFDIETDGKPRRINVPDYYKEYYGSPVRKPRLPCIQYGRTAYVPLEFVHFADFNSLPPTNLTAEQTSEMIKISAIKPPERARGVMKWREELAYEKQKKIDAWGLEVNHDMVEVNARILPTPQVQYRTSKVQPNNGQWRMRGQRFARANSRPLTNWAVVSFDRHCDISDMQRWIRYLTQRLRNFGIEIANERPTLIEPRDPRNPNNLTSSLQEAARAAYMVDKNTPQLILVILPGKDAWLYETIKKLSFTDLKAPVATQCMQAAKIKNERGLDSYTDNLAMKIAAKLGGLSHAVPNTFLPGVVPGKTMILGADLGHPPVRPGQQSRDPTVACSIATYNDECNAFSAQIRLQEGRSEIIADLSNMVEQHLRIFAQHNDGEYPSRILIFRDGISEGQYAATSQYELDAIVKACARIVPTYRPAVLICACAKRHNTRFFGIGTDGVDARTQNLQSGLGVDSTVTHPYAFDFFLQAHAGLVGTARPTHYICLVDELGLTPDDLQKLVHGLCHGFARCTSSVSLVPVCYMADLVCQKARVIVQKGHGDTSPSVTSHTRSNVPGGGSRAFWWLGGW